MRRRGQGTTIGDVAKAAGVSIATVSRVLSESNYPVSSATRAKVLEHAKHLAYRKSNDIFSPGESVLQDIGVIVPTLTNPFYSELILGIENECKRHSCIPVICSSMRNGLRETQNIELLLSKNIRNLIISSWNEGIALPARLRTRIRNMVFFDQAKPQDSMSYVCFDHFEAGRLATEYLLLRGHRRICFASPPMTREIRRDLLNGYKRALDDFHQPFEPEYVLLPQKEQDDSTMAYDFNNGLEMARSFVRITSKPTAVFAVNDVTAYGMIHTFRDLGLRIPEDVSIISCDNLNTSQVTNPPLTTIQQPAYETGRLACQVLIKEMNREAQRPTQIFLRPSLVERSSVSTI